MAAPTGPVTGVARPFSCVTHEGQNNGNAILTISRITLTRNAGSPSRLPPLGNHRTRAAWTGQSRNGCQ